MKGKEIMKFSPGKKVLLNYNFFSPIILFLFISSIAFAQDNRPTDTTTLPPSAVNPSDPWLASNIITIPDFLSELNNKENQKFITIQVGFKSLYEASHVPGAIYAGPADRNEGITLLKSEAKKLKKNQNIVIYCGCCAWSECPNIRKAFDVIKNLGFKNVHVVYIPHSFMTDWVDKGYPIDKGKIN